jgi:hypothetical protein
VLDAASLDPDGRGHMRAYLDAFYREIESDDRFYRPVVVRPRTVARTGPDPSAPAVCPNRAEIPVGTPISEPLDTRDSMIRVVVLDALWHWAPPVRCPAMQRDAVWIDASAVSRDFPTR